MMSEARRQKSERLSRPPLERMQVIIGLMRRGNYPNATGLARLLETSKKSIHRDIEFLRDRLFFDIRYDGSRFGYFLAQGPCGCPFCNPDDGPFLKGRSAPRHPVYGGAVDVAEGSNKTLQRKSHYS